MWKDLTNDVKEVKKPTKWVESQREEDSRQRVKEDKRKQSIKKEGGNQNKGSRKIL